MPEGSAAPFHVGLTPERIVDVALDLTGESHLFGWSIRDLARRLDVAASVVYHHIGGKDLIARRVVERVLARVSPPSPGVEWQEWFRTLLLSVRPLMVEYPGVAKWLLMHGPAFEVAASIIDDGVAALQRAGFGDRTGFAYAALFNTALLTISMSDERLDHEDDGPRDHAAMMREFQQLGDSSPGLALLTDSLVSPFATGGQDADRMAEDYFRFIVETTIAGLTTLLPHR